MSDFELLTSYWPARTGMYWWENFDREEVKRDFDRAAALSIRQLAIALSWHQVQPEPGRLASNVLHDLEQVLQLANDRSLGVAPILFPVDIFSTLWLPSWTLEVGTTNTRQVVSGHHVSRTGVKDLWGDARMVSAELRQVREILGAFGGHPAISRWVIGSGLTIASSPSSRSVFTEWLGAIGETATSGARGQPLAVSISAGDLVTSSSVDVAAIHGAGFQVQISADWQPSWAQLSEAGWCAYLSSYATCLAGAPVVVADIGKCTAENEMPEVGGCGNELAVSDELGRTADAIHMSGGAGCRAAALFDFVPALRGVPPFRWQPHSLTRGLVRAGGMPKESARIWSDLGRAAMAVLPVPEYATAVNPEERNRNPETVAREWFEAFRQ